MNREEASGFIKVGTAKTAGECAALVLRTMPNADGASFGVKKNQGTCMASLKSTGHVDAWDWDKWNDEGEWMSCLFNSEY